MSKTFEEKSYVVVITNNFSDFIIIYLFARKSDLKKDFTKIFKIYKD